MNRTRQRGFASIVAILMIGLVGAAILAVTSLLTADARRTSNEWRDAQLRQLLVAGLASDGMLDELPDKLLEQGYRVSVERSTTPESIVLTIIARDASRQITQTTEIDLSGRLRSTRLR